MKSVDDLIQGHIEAALWLAHGKTTSPSQQYLVDALTGVLQDICVLNPRQQEREARARV